MAVLAAATAHASLALAPPSPSRTTAAPPRPPLGPFHAIDLFYPGLRPVHTDPDVWAIDGFLSNDECDRIVAKCAPHLTPCQTINDDTGAVEADEDRTSTNAGLPRREAPSVVSRIERLARCDATNLEALQVLRYEEGQAFVPHTDGFEGPTTACGFVESGRVATVFVYLNDVARGGQTRFVRLGGPGSGPLDIVPRKGMAIVHFPATLEFEEDKRTRHEGVAAVDEKWLLTTWVWKHACRDERWEASLPTLGDDII